MLLRKATFYEESYDGVLNKLHAYNYQTCQQYPQTSYSHTTCPQ